MDELDRKQTEAYNGFFPVVMGEDVRIRNGGGLIVLSRNQTLDRGGAQWLIAGREQTIHQGGGAFLISREAHVTGGLVGVLVSGRTTLDGGARVLATLTVPAALAAAAAFVVGLLLGRRGAR